MNPMDRLILAILEEGYLWSPAMVSAYHEHEPNSFIKLTEQWFCPFCGTDKDSPNGTGGDIACCGEIGHAERTMILKEPNGHASNL